MRSMSQLVALHLPYVVAASGFGVVWLFANPEFWKRTNRDAAAYLLFAGASLAVALLLRGLIHAATGWAVWGLAVLVVLVGHYLVNWGFFAVIAIQGGLPREPMLDAALKGFVIVPTVFLTVTLMLLPIYVPLGAAYVWLLRWIDRQGGARRELVIGAIGAVVLALLAAIAGAFRHATARAEEVKPTMDPSRPWTPGARIERTIASAVRDASAVVVARAEDPFVVQGEKAVAKGPPYTREALPRVALTPRKRGRGGARGAPRPARSPGRTRPPARAPRRARRGPAPSRRAPPRSPRWPG
jgi:hypothetical protein